MAEGLFDPKGLIRDAFAIDGISAAECRSIFLDWALGVPEGSNTQAELGKLIAHYGPQMPADHPMMQTMQAGLAPAAGPRRRGGRRARVADDR